MSDVPCNGCKSCCVNDAIMLHPDCGDNPADFKTVPFTNPLTGVAGLMVAKKPLSTECYYLGSNGCTIHGRAPVICREFDCGKVYAAQHREPWKTAIRVGMVAPEVLTQGHRVTIIRNSQRASLPPSRGAGA